MYISDRIRVVYVKIPKTGGTAVRRTVRDMGFKRLGSRFSHLSKIPTPELYADYSIFAVVRNPFDRLISEYRFHCLTRDVRPDFVEWLESTPLSNRVQWHAVRHPKLKCEAIRYEDDPLSRVRQICGTDKRIGYSRDTQYLGHYDRSEWATNDAVQWILENCREDFERLRYSDKPDFEVAK